MKKNLTFVLLGFSLGISLMMFSSFRNSETAVNPGPGYSGTTIAAEQARAMVHAYKSENSKAKCGAFISREMITYLMSDTTNATGVVVYLGQNDQKDMEILLTGGTSNDTLINTEVSSFIFQASSFCPDQCGLLLCE